MMRLTLSKQKDVLYLTPYGRKPRNNRRDHWNWTFGREPENPANISIWYVLPYGALEKRTRDQCIEAPRNLENGQELWETTVPQTLGGDNLWLAEKIYNIGGQGTKT